MERDTQLCGSESSFLYVHCYYEVMVSSFLQNMIRKQLKIFESVFSLLSYKLDYFKFLRTGNNIIK